MGKWTEDILFRLISRNKNRYIYNYEACYIAEDIIEEIPFQLFIELNNEVKRFIKVNQMLIYGIENKNINIVEDAVNRFVNLLKKYKK